MRLDLIFKTRSKCNDPHRTDYLKPRSISHEFDSAVLIVANFSSLTIAHMLAVKKTLGVASTVLTFGLATSASF